MIIKREEGTDELKPSMQIASKGVEWRLIVHMGVESSFSGDLLEMLLDVRKDGFWPFGWSWTNDEGKCSRLLHGLSHTNICHRITLIFER